jgi:regulator of sigma E protease
MLVTILVFIVILSILVLIHELGHFLIAKKFGIKVEEFGYGFPPRLFGKKIGETLYSFNLLPIGGFVKLYGEDEAGGGSLKKSQTHEHSHDLNRAFFAKPAWQKALVVFAGVVMNFVLAVVIISYLFTVKGVAVPTEHIRIVEVVEGSPAARAGIREGDEALSINGKKLTEPKEFIDLTKKSAGKPLKLEVKRGDQLLDLTLTPRTVTPDGEGPLGVAINNIEVKKYAWYEAPFYGTLEAFKFSWMILSGIGGILFNLVSRGQAPTDVAGPVGVAQLVGQAVGISYEAVLWVAALLSLNLAVVNVLPIPALDGGRLFFILIEMVFRKKVSAKYETMAHAVGLAVLLALILLITVFDVTRLLSGQSLLPEM